MKDMGNNKVQLIKETYRECPKVGIVVDDLVSLERERISLLYHTVL